MQETVFKFTDRPFSSDLRVERYFPAESIEAARLAIARTIERAEGCSLIIGPPGCGKTMLCHVLAKQFREQFSSVILTGARLPSRKSLLQAILFELGLRYRRMEEGELRLSLIDHLTPRQDGNDGMLLMVDEAHTLSPKLLEELRLLTNLVRNGSPRVRLVLAGGAILEERFASPKLASFNQRLTARCYLEPFSSEETQQYVRAQVAAVGGNPDQIFTDKALRAIHRATDGIVRLVDQLCDHALLLAAAGQTTTIDEPGIEEAWADLQQLPMPWNTDGPPEATLDGETSTTVEFSSVDEDEHDPDGFEDVNAEHPDSDPASTVPFAAVELETADPAGQLDQIQQQMDSVGEDFQPIGSIGPQIELNFGDFDESSDAPAAASSSTDFDDEFDDDLGPVIDPSESASTPTLDDLTDELGWQAIEDAPHPESPTAAEQRQPAEKAKPGLYQVSSPGDFTAEDSTNKSVERLPAADPVYLEPGVAPSAMGTSPIGPTAGDITIDDEMIVRDDAGETGKADFADDPVTPELTASEPAVPEPTTGQLPLQTRRNAIGGVHREETPLPPVGGEVPVEKGPVEKSGTSRRRFGKLFTGLRKDGQP